MLNRRLFPLVLAGAALLPAIAGAQGRNTANDGRAPGPGAAPQSDTPPANLAGRPPAELAKLVHDAGAFSLMTARLGIEKATRPEIKRFANFEVREQEGVAAAMKLAGHDFPEPQPAGEKLQVMNRLRSADGAEFDRLFLQVQEQGHQELLNLTTAIGEGQAPAPDKIVALLSTDRIQEHLITIGMLRG